MNRSDFFIFLGVCFCFTLVGGLLGGSAGAFRTGALGGLGSLAVFLYLNRKDS